MTFKEWKKWIMSVDSGGRFDYAHDDTPESTWRLRNYYTSHEAINEAIKTTNERKRIRS